jgi:hypothetical protein
MKRYYNKAIDKRMVITMHIYKFSAKEIADRLKINRDYVYEIVGTKENYIGTETLYK